MGSCSSQEMKKILKLKLQETKQKQSQSTTPNRSTTQQNVARSNTRCNTQNIPQIVNVQSMNTFCLQNINQSIVYRSTNFSTFYSLLKKEEKDFPFTTIQHNNTGILRIIKSYKLTEVKYVASLLNYQLHHPNLIQQYEIYEEQQKYHVAEENNKEIVILNSKMFITEQDIAFIFNQIVEVIDYIHHQQLTHGHLTIDSFALFGEKYIKLYDLFHLFMKKKPSFEETHYLPPEYFEFQQYTEERDIWSLGIILYQLLYRTSPYDSTTLNKLRIEILISEIQFEQSISDEAISLLKQLLEKNPKKRIKLIEITKHPWFLKQQVFLREEQVRETLLRLRKSKKLNILQAYILKFIINNYRPDKLRDIYSVFRSLDLDNDGFFSLSELQASYKEFILDSDKTKSICMNIFTKVDMDKDSKITFAEFILYAIQRKTLIQEEVLDTSFKLLKNKKNFITAESLAAQFSLEKEYFTEILMDILKKDYLAYNNFKDLMLEII
ncbi:unnamed protein product [Paramecium sonneborni]|uniref:Protein kinase domain containing protein n=1 Tax=Paramecium sonneborni TaxID=65129 RepID=A0A8S1KIX3_9CILI|nr:unnamed protein product [Paramecium sonneborni]